MEKMSTTDDKMKDIELIEEHNGNVDEDPERAAEEKALVRKIDLFLLPTIWIMYLLSYMDRTNIGNAKIAGMTDDLGMDSNQYSIALVVVSERQSPFGQKALLIVLVLRHLCCLRSSEQSNLVQDQALDISSGDHVALGGCNVLHGSNRYL